MLIDVIVDAGESGKSLDRPGIQEALDRLDRREADGIVVAKLDRLSRNVGDWNWLITEYFGEKPGKQTLECRRLDRHQNRDRSYGAQHPDDSRTMETRDHR